MGDAVWVIVNNDFQLKLKKGSCFMKEEERLRIVSSLRWTVGTAFLSRDVDLSVSKTIEMLVKAGGPENEYVFANGGDIGDEASVREAETCRRLGVSLAFGVGGTDKIQSSSWLLSRAKHAV